MAFGVLTGRRARQVATQGSEDFEYIPVALAAGVRLVVNIGGQFPRSVKYAPLDYTQVINRSSVVIQLKWNGQQRTERIPAGMMLAFPDRAVHTLTITNLDVAVATVEGELSFVFNRGAKDADDLGKKYG